MNKARTPKFIFSGTGQVTKSAVGRYVAKVVAQSNASEIERPLIRSRVKSLLWIYLQRDFTAEHFDNYINALLEELRVGNACRSRVVAYTQTLFSYFERQLVFYQDLDSIDSSIPDDFLR